MRISADHADARVWALTEGSWSPVCPRGAKQFITAWPPTPQREPLIMDHFDDPVCRDLPSRFSPAPSLGGPIAWSQNERSVGGLGTTMMTLTHQTRKNYLLRKEDYGQLHQKFRSSIEILIFLWWLHRIKINYSTNHRRSWIRSFELNRSIQLNLSLHVLEYSLKKIYI